MKEFVIYLLKSGIITILFLSVYWVFLKKATFFRFNRFYLLAGIMVAIALPFYVYTYDVEVVASAFGTPVFTEGNVTQTTQVINIWQVIACVYFSVVALLLLRSTFYITKFFRNIRHKQKIDCKDYILIDDEDVKSPYSAYRFILLNSDSLSQVEKDVIILHEKSHIQQYHFCDLLLCELFCIFQWYNPFAWKYATYVKSNHEYLADAAVLETGVKLHTYNAVLANQIIIQSGLSLISSFSFNYSKRLLMMSTKKSNTWKKAIVVVIFPLLSVLVWASGEPNYIVKSSGSENEIHIRNSGHDPLLIINEKEYPYSFFSMLDVQYIESISVLKDESAIAEYGEKGKNGVIKVVLKPDFDYSALDSPESVESDPLLIINGKEHPYTSMGTINPEWIESVSVLKDESAIQKYGQKAKHGVVEIKLKPGYGETMQKENSINLQDVEAILQDEKLRYMEYDFNTQKGQISQLVTQQGEGYVTGEQINPTSNEIQDAYYITCPDDEQPHFYLKMTKAKVKKNKITSGPAQIQYE